ncbi:hypothetical protein [Pseudooceanicola atlanticus]|nr:hypothetical protein [Pseudooceanicola atlanticus]
MLHDAMDDHIGAVAPLQNRFAQMSDSGHARPNWPKTPDGRSTEALNDRFDLKRAMPQPEWTSALRVAERSICFYLNHMLNVADALRSLLTANAFIAFAIAFYWHARVIFTLFNISNWDGAFLPWKALRNPASFQNSFRRFIAGEIFPELRRKWSMAIGYVAVSFLVLFLVDGFLQIVAPEHLL